MIVSRHHNGSPHLRRQIREIHSLRTGRFHGTPGRATNLPCPVTPHHETVTRLFREKLATGQPPSRNSRLHGTHFTNPPPPSQNSQTKPSANSTGPSATRPNHQQPDQSTSSQTSPSATQPNHQHDPEAKKLSTGQRTVSSTTKLPATRPNSNRTENHQPAKEPPADQRTICRPSCPISGPCRR